MGHAHSSSESSTGTNDFENIRWEGAHPDASKPVENPFKCDGCLDEFPTYSHLAHCLRNGKFAKPRDPFVVKTLEASKSSSSASSAVNMPSAHTESQGWRAYYWCTKEDILQLTSR